MTYKAIDSTHLDTGAIVGSPVFNLEGEKLGKIVELIIDFDSGRIAFAILSFGGFLGMGDKLVALPWPLVSFDPDHEGAVLDVPKEKLRQAPTFDDTSPLLNSDDDQTRSESIHRYFGVDPDWR